MYDISTFRPGRRFPRSAVLQKTIVLLVFRPVGVEEARQYAARGALKNKKSVGAVPPAASLRLVTVSSRMSQSGMLTNSPVPVKSKATRTRALVRHSAIACASGFYRIEGHAGDTHTPHRFSRQCGSPRSPGTGAQPVFFCVISFCVKRGGTILQRHPEFVAELQDDRIERECVIERVILAQRIVNLSMVEIAFP